VTEREFIGNRVAPLEVQHMMKQFGVESHRAMNCAETAYMLRVAPSRIMGSAIGVREECKRCQRTGRRRRNARRNVEPLRAPA
jgi:hypothetical protein